MTHTRAAMGLVARITNVGYIELVVQVMCGLNLPLADMSKHGTPQPADPYCMILWNDQLVGRSRTINNSSNPIWGGYGRSKVRVPLLPTVQTSTLRIEVRDYDPEDAVGDLLGQVVITGAEMERCLAEDDDGITDKTYHKLKKKLNCTEQQKVKGELGIVYKAKDEYSMLVTVADAKGLANLDAGADKSDPFCIVFWNGIKIGTTRHIADDLSPSWEETFEVPLRPDLPSSLRVEVRDFDGKGTTGCFLGQAYINGSDMQHHSSVPDWPRYYAMQPDWNANEEQSLVQGSIGLALTCITPAIIVGVLRACPDDWETICSSAWVVQQFAHKPRNMLDCVKAGAVFALVHIHMLYLPLACPLGSEDEWVRCRTLGSSDLYAKKAAAAANAAAAAAAGRRMSAEEIMHHGHQDKVKCTMEQAQKVIAAVESTLVAMAHASKSFFKSVLEFQPGGHTKTQGEGKSTSASFTAAGRAPTTLGSNSGVADGLVQPSRDRGIEPKSAPPEAAFAAAAAAAFIGGIEGIDGASPAVAMNMANANKESAPVDSDDEDEAAAQLAAKAPKSSSKLPSAGKAKNLGAFGFAKSISMPNLEQNKIARSKTLKHKLLMATKATSFTRSAKDGINDLLASQCEDAPIGEGGIAAWTAVMAIDVLQHAGYSAERLQKEGACAAAVNAISSFPRHRTLVALGLQCLRRVMVTSPELAAAALTDQIPAMQVVHTRLLSANALVLKDQDSVQRSSKNQGQTRCVVGLNGAALFRTGEPPKNRFKVKNNAVGGGDTGMHGGDCSNPFWTDAVTTEMSAVANHAVDRARHSLAGQDTESKLSLVAGSLMDAREEAYELNLLTSLAKCELRVEVRDFDDDDGDGDPDSVGDFMGEVRISGAELKQFKYMAWFEHNFPLKRKAQYSSNQPYVQGDMTLQLQLKADFLHVGISKCNGLFANTDAGGGGGGAAGDAAPTKAQLKRERKKASGGPDLSDPYCLIFWNDELIGKTRPVENSINPSFNEHFSVPLLNARVHEQSAVSFEIRRHHYSMRDKRTGDELHELLGIRNFKAAEIEAMVGGKEGEGEQGWPLTMVDTFSLQSKKHSSEDLSSTKANSREAKAAQRTRSPGGDGPQQGPMVQLELGLLTAATQAAGIYTTYALERASLCDTLDAMGETPYTIAKMRDVIGIMGRCVDIMTRSVATNAGWEHSTSNGGMRTRTQPPLRKAIGVMARTLRHTANRERTSNFFRAEQMHVRAVMDYLFNINKKAVSKWVELEVIQANGLTNADMDDKALLGAAAMSDPFMEAYWNGAKLHESPVMADTLDPTFKAATRFPISSDPDELAKCDLKIVVRDYDADGIEDENNAAHEFLGMVHLTGADMMVIMFHAFAAEAGANGSASPIEIAGMKRVVADHFERTGENMRVHPNGCELVEHNNDGSMVFKLCKWRGTKERASVSGTMTIRLRRYIPGAGHLQSDIVGPKGDGSSQDVEVSSESGNDEVVRPRTIEAVLRAVAAISDTRPMEHDEMGMKVADTVDNDEEHAEAEAIVIERTMASTVRILSGVTSTTTRQRRLFVGVNMSCTETVVSALNDWCDMRNVVSSSVCVGALANILANAMKGMSAKQDWKNPDKLAWTVQNAKGEKLLLKLLKSANVLCAEQGERDTQSGKRREAGAATKEKRSPEQMALWYMTSKTLELVETYMALRKSTGFEFEDLARPNISYALANCADRCADLMLSRRNTVGVGGGGVGGGGIGGQQSVLREAIANACRGCEEELGSCFRLVRRLNKDEKGHDGSTFKIETATEALVLARLARFGMPPSAADVAVATHMDEGAAAAAAAEASTMKKNRRMSRRVSKDISAAMALSGAKDDLKAAFKAKQGEKRAPPLQRIVSTQELLMDLDLAVKPALFSPGIPASGLKRMTEAQESMKTKSKRRMSRRASKDMSALMANTGKQQQLQEAFKAKTAKAEPVSLDLSLLYETTQLLQQATDSAKGRKAIFFKSTMVTEGILVSMARAVHSLAGEKARERSTPTNQASGGSTTASLNLLLVPCVVTLRTLLEAVLSKGKGLDVDADSIMSFEKEWIRNEMQKLQVVLRGNLQQGLKSAEVGQLEDLSQVCERAFAAGEAGANQAALAAAQAAAEEKAEKDAEERAERDAEEKVRNEAEQKQRRAKWEAEAAQVAAAAKEVELTSAKEAAPQAQEAAPQEVAANTAATFKDGQQVQARHGGGEVWYRGSITAAHGNGTFDITYDDGDQEEGVPAEYIKESNGEEEDESGEDDYGSEDDYDEDEDEDEGEGEDGEEEGEDEGGEDEEGRAQEEERMKKEAEEAAQVKAAETEKRKQAITERRLKARAQAEAEEKAKQEAEENAKKEAEEKAKQKAAEKEAAEKAKQQVEDEDDDYGDEFSDDAEEDETSDEEEGVEEGVEEAAAKVAELEAKMAALDTKAPDVEDDMKKLDFGAASDADSDVAGEEEEDEDDEGYEEDEWSMSHHSDSEKEAEDDPWADEN
jgi:hypothetical protein